MNELPVPRAKSEAQLRAAPHILEDSFDILWSTWRFNFGCFKRPWPWFVTVFFFMISSQFWDSQMGFFQMIWGSFETLGLFQWFRLLQWTGIVPKDFFGIRWDSKQLKMPSMSCFETLWSIWDRSKGFFGIRMDDSNGFRSLLRFFEVLVEDMLIDDTFDTCRFSDIPYDSSRVWEQIRLLTLLNYLIIFQQLDSMF